MYFLQHGRGKITCGRMSRAYPMQLAQAIFSMGDTMTAQWENESI